MLWCRGAQMVPNLYFSFYISKNEEKKQNIKRQDLHWFFHQEISFKVGLSDRNEAFFSLEIEAVNFVPDARKSGNIRLSAEAAKRKKQKC